MMIIQLLEFLSRWAPAVGSVGDTLVVAGGGNWGTNTIEVKHDQCRMTPVRMMLKGV